MIKELTTILTIAGSDSTGGAGIQTDIRAAASLGVFAMTAVTAVTAQNSSGVARVDAVPPSLLKAQLEAVAAEVTPAAVKIGMTCNSENVRIIADYLDTLPPFTPVVIDPVMASTAGGALSQTGDNLADALMGHLFPKATIVTPNLKEAALFLDLPEENILPEDTEETACRFLRRSGSRAVVLKGGHLNGDAVIDTLAIKEEETPENDMQSSVTIKKYCSKRINCINLHGTGCTYASLLAAEMANGKDIAAAFLSASRGINEIIRMSRGYHFGNSSYGPLNIFDYKLK